MAKNTLTVKINGKERKAKLKYGIPHVTISFLCRADLADQFAQKNDYLTTSDDFVLNSLVRDYTVSFGWTSQGNVKDPGSLFDPRVRHHSKDAALKTVQSVSKCEFSTN